MVPLGAEVALAFLGGAATFALVAVALAATESDVVAVVLGAVCLAAVVAIAGFWGAAYAVPAAIASLVAYDWFQFPPTHPREFPASADLLDLAMYLVVAVLVGELAAYTGRRADISEEGRSELLAEQAALRRVATLVANGESPNAVFGAVAKEVGQLLAVDGARVIRYEGDDEIMHLAAWSAPGHDVLPLGRMKLEGTTLASEVLRTGGVARMDDYANINPAFRTLVESAGIRSGVGAPIVVDGHLWGVMLAWSMHDQPLPDTAEARLAHFTGLVATAISNTASREELARLADEQAALRRVATLVARESPPAEVFATVAEEVARLLGVEDTKIYRYEADGTITVVADWGEPDFTIPVGSRLGLGGENIGSEVHRTGRPARVDDYAHATGTLAERARELGVRSGVGTPIVVEGRVWGVIIAASRQSEPLPAGTESRIAEFTELVATAISNIQARADLAASRARIVAAADEERRRVVRDLHDGAQQRLVHTVITLKLAGRALRTEQQTAPALVTEALQQAERATAEVRELAHGILPSVLTRGGLRAGVDALASRMPVPVENGVSVGRLPAAVEATAYFVVAEALTNVAKHAGAGRAVVTAHVEDGTLSVQVRDDGVGGARPDGSGLVGLADRLAVLDGRLRVESPTDGGTLIAAAIPLGD
jgi:signal transduction histidine kinase